MRIVASLFLLLGLAAVVIWLRPRFAGTVNTEQLASVLSVGLLMIGAYLTGRLCEKVKLPAITGYLVLGVVAGPYVLGLISRSQTSEHLVFANDLAVALIALTAGGEIRLDFLRGQIRPISLVLLIHMGILFLGVGVAIALAGPGIQFLRDTTTLQRWVIAMLAAVVMVAKSPAVTIAMISDYRAKGPLCQTTLIITVIKDLLLIFLFATVVAISRGLLHADAQPWHGFVLAVVVQLVGSVLLGAAFGLLMAWYLRKVAAHVPIFVVGFCLLVALLGEQRFEIAGGHGHLEPLLMALSAGLLLRNAFPQRARTLFDAVEWMSLPVYCLFFALAGARFDLRVFATLWWLSIALVAVRLAATWGGMKLGLAAARMHEPWANMLWLGMVSQAGVSLVLVTLIADKFAYDWASPLRDVLVGAILVNQLVGPMLFRHALMKSGEASARQRRDPQAVASRLAGAH